MLLMILIGLCCGFAVNNFYLIWRITKLNTAINKYQRILLNKKEESLKVVSDALDDGTLSQGQALTLMTRMCNKWKDVK
jgi:hypothetical protein